MKTLTMTLLAPLFFLLGSRSYGQAQDYLEARQAFLEGRYVEAREPFAQMGRDRPGDPQALFGYARALHALHQYQEAIEAYEGALEQAPSDDAIRTDYVAALTWGGILKGDRRWLDKAIAEAKEALREDPSRIEIYHSLRTAVREAKPDTGYIEILQSLQQVHRESPVLSVKLHEARLQEAQRSRDSVEVAAVKDQLCADLERLNLRDDRPEVLYALALGSTLLDEEGKAEQALQRLERTPRGHVMAEPIRYWYQFMEEEGQARQAGHPAEHVQVGRRWMDRFVPNWETGDSKARALRGMHLRALLAQAKEETADSAHKRLSPALADSIITLGTELARTDTWDRAGHYYTVSNFLVEQKRHLDQAAALAGEGMAALEAGEPGMIYPGTQGADLEKTRTRYLANLRRIRGQALAEMGKERQAEVLLREAAASGPSAANYAALGRFLLSQGKVEEGVDVLLKALAESFGHIEAALEQEVRQLVEDVQAEHRVLSVAWEEEIRRRKEVREREKEEELLANKLNQPAPGFALVDTQGRVWRLETLKGKAVVLNFWATWCAPCIAELPHFQALFEEYAGKEDVALLAISTDEDPEMVREWLAEQGYTFTVLHDDGTSVDYHVTGVPETFFIDPSGRIQYRTVGFPGEDEYFEQMHKRIEALRTPE